jgi:hypothetical protein
MEEIVDAVACGVGRGLHGVYLVILADAIENCIDQFGPPVPKIDPPTMPSTVSDFASFFWRVR